MPSFIEDLATVFHPDLDEAHGKRTVGTPFPEVLILIKSTTPDEGEVDRNIVRGYQRLVGSLLWCVRHVSPICAYGCSQLWLATGCLLKHGGAATKSCVVSTTNSNSIRSVKTAH